MECFDILIVGGGAAGISAAKAAYKAGCRSILLVDDRETLGGVLRQCMHAGFGPGVNGPDYIKNLTAELPENITVWRNATVMAVSADRTARILGADIGERNIVFRQLILAAGCREIPMGALPVAGTRPAGIYTAGQMQERINLEGICPEGPVVILGSGDLGLIMADHIAGLGLPVTLVEKRQTCGGMVRNQKCLQKPNVRLLCGTTIEEVFGNRKIERVQLTDGEVLPCKTLLIAIGLIPEQELIRGLGNRPWMHICGNCRSVHPMVEAVVKEGTQTGIHAWEQIMWGL